MTARARTVLLHGLAALLAGAMISYAAVWMLAAHRRPTAFLGIEFREAPAGIEVTRVLPETPASRAGLAAGDRLIGVDGEGLAGSPAPFADRVVHGRPGARVAFALAPAGGGAPRMVEAVLGPAAAPRETLSQRVVGELLGAYPAPFVAVAVVVLLLRVEDRNAWLLALLFAGLIASAPALELQVPPGLRGASLAFKVAFDGTAPGLFLFFFSVFPARSALDRRLGWLKWLWLLAGTLGALPAAAWALAAGGTSEMEQALRRTGGRPLHAALLAYYFGGFLLGLVSLLWSAVRAPAPARRRGRVIVWGMLAGFIPMLVLFAAASWSDRTPYDFPLWVWAPCVLLLFLIPLAFAYAVVVDRALEIPVLLRRSARYLLVQRGSAGVLLLAGIGATLAFAVSFGRYLGPHTEAAGIGFGASFGTLLVWTGIAVHRRVRERIDRAFFRSAYDARQVLQELAERARGATGRAELGALLEHQVRTALLPGSLAVYLESRAGELRLEAGSSPAGVEVLSPTQAPLPELARRARPWELAATPAGEPLGDECLVPILGRDARLAGVMALGPRLSEEPYSREDQQLLASVASQAGIALETVRLAEQMADRLEAERRADQEMALAQNVQSRLLPQAPLALATLRCVGRCVQARAVGGDYFDFLDLGQGRVVLALADVSGKGFPAALLMANLQASLRSRSPQDLLDPVRQLAAMNQALYRFSEPSRYATLFFGLYEDATRRLRYVNCGHNPPLLVRADGGLERLFPTAPVLGLLEDWECAAAEVELRAGDLLALFSDGITEAFSDDGEEFGEERLIALLRERRDEPVDSLADAVIETVRVFSGSEQEDDQTLVLARAR